MYGINRYKGLPKVFFTSPFKGTVLSGDWRFSRDASSCSSFCFALWWLRSTWRRQKPFGNKLPHKILGVELHPIKGFLLSEGNLRFVSPFRLTIICMVLGSRRCGSTKLWGLTKLWPVPLGRDRERSLPAFPVWPPVDLSIMWNIQQLETKIRWLETCGDNEWVFKGI